MSWTDCQVTIRLDVSDLVASLDDSSVRLTEFLVWAENRRIIDNVLSNCGPGGHKNSKRSRRILALARGT